MTAATRATRQAAQLRAREGEAARLTDPSGWTVDVSAVIFRRPADFPDAETGLEIRSEARFALADLPAAPAPGAVIAAGAERWVVDRVWSDEQMAICMLREDCT
jgi:hypothetical protein